MLFTNDYIFYLIFVTFLCYNINTAIKTQLILDFIITVSA